MREYRSRWGMFTTDLLVRNKNMHIVFTSFRLGGSYFATEDEEVINALESDSAFGKDFYLFSKKEPEKTKKGAVPNPDDGDGGKSKAGSAEKTPSNNEDNSTEEVKSQTVVEDVRNISDAREYLKKLGIDYRKLNTANAVAKQAAEANVQFPNLK